MKNRSFVVPFLSMLLCFVSCLLLLFGFVVVVVVAVGLLLLLLLLLLFRYLPVNRTAVVVYGTKPRHPPMPVGRNRAITFP